MDFFLPEESTVLYSLMVNLPNFVCISNGVDIRIKSEVV